MPSSNQRCFITGLQTEEISISKSEVKNFGDKVHKVKEGIVFVKVLKVKKVKIVSNKYVTSLISAKIHLESQGKNSTDANQMA